MSETSDPLVYIIVLSWNSCEDVLRCLTSVHAMSYNNYRGLLVDNASTDDTVAAVRATFPDWEIIENAQNLKFAAGCNVGLCHALEQQAEFILLLNQDVVVDPSLLMALINAAGRQPNGGIFGPKTYSMRLSSSGRPRLLYTGSWRRYLPLLQRIPGIETVDDGLYDEARRVDYVWGHGMFIRADLLQKIGLLDPAFIFYYEDLDLCRRATDAGYEIWYVPDAHIWHDTEDGARASASEAWRWQHKVKGMRTYYHKYYGRPLGMILLALTVLDMSARMAFHCRYRAVLHLILSWLHLIAEQSIMFALKGCKTKVR